MSYLTLENVSKSFGTGEARTEVLKDVNLTVRKGEFVAILGYSGTGKSTLMSMLAGLTQPDSGRILHNGKPVNGPSADRGIVFQNYSLLPWLTVAGNVRLAVDQFFGDESSADRAARVERALKMVNLQDAASKKPGALSGGMRQRTSVARTLAIEPDVLLLDEPLSALDALTRSVIQDEILEIWEREHQTIILITNDVDEGLLMADRVIPLSAGPASTFGPEVVVDIPRPRDRTAINRHPAFAKLRSRIIDYLISQKEDGNETRRAVPALPAIKPSSRPEFRERGPLGWLLSDRIAPGTTL